MRRMRRDGTWIAEEDEDTTGMLSPVRCKGCGKVYDLGEVEVTARYADCSMWNTPCCKRLTDSRPVWHTGPGYVRLY